MTVVVEEIPESIRPEVDSALAWLNRERGSAFRVTGLVDPEEAIARRASAPDAPVELGLVLCQGDLCLRERVQVRPAADGFEVALANSEDGPKDEPPPHLDPPPGTRKGWIEEQLARHAFVVLVFYRGFW